MSYITASLARQTAISRANRAEMDIIRANEAQQNMLNSRHSNLDSVAKKDAMLEAKKEQASVKANVAKAYLKNSKGTRHKIDVIV